MSLGFWIGVLVMVGIVIGISVLAGHMLSRNRAPPERSRRHAQVTALKASGALRHRKSNRP